MLIDRVLLCCIKQLGKYPCPTCLILKKKVLLLGTKHNAWTHTHHKCTDDHVYWLKIKTTQKHIYLNGQLLNGKWLDALLSAESLVPTEVHETPKFKWVWLLIYLSECIFLSIIKTRLWFLFNVCAWFTSRVWIGCLEVDFQTFDEDPVCAREWLCPNVK